MLIYRHHTCGDKIDIDDRTGRWIPVDVEAGTIIVGSRTMGQRAGCELGGSYAIEDGRRFHFFWNEDGELVLRTDDLRLALFRLAPDGGLVELLPQLSVALRPARHGDGRAMPGMSRFTVSDGGNTLIDIVYDSARYVRYYLGNFTFAPDEDLRDWDFFVAVERELVELRLLAAARVAAGGHAPDSVYGMALVTLRTGEPAPRAGIWAAVHHLAWRCPLALGETLSATDAPEDTWVWVPSWNDDAANEVVMPAG